jgi:hypothetical protein
MNSHHKEPFAISDGIRLVRERLQDLALGTNNWSIRSWKNTLCSGSFESDVCDNPLPRANVIYADLGDELTPKASELVSYLIANDFQAIWYWITAHQMSIENCKNRFRQINKVESSYYRI